MTTVVVVGNPKPNSRTLAAATRLATSLTGEPDLVVDLATLGPVLLDRADPDVADLVKQVGAAELVIVASPTYKGAYTGLLKLFLDRFAGGTGLSGLAVPLMLGAGPTHALAPEDAVNRNGYVVPSALFLGAVPYCRTVFSHADFTDRQLARQ